MNCSICGPALYRHPAKNATQPTPGAPAYTCCSHTIVPRETAQPVFPSANHYPLQRPTKRSTLAGTDHASPPSVTRLANQPSTAAVTGLFTSTTPLHRTVTLQPLAISEAAFPLSSSIAPHEPSTAAAGLSDNVAARANSNAGALQSTTLVQTSPFPPCLPTRHEANSTKAQRRQPSSPLTLLIACSRHRSHEMSQHAYGGYCSS